MRIHEYLFLTAALLMLAGGCSQNASREETKDETKPLFMNILPQLEGGYSIISISPFDGSHDTMRVNRPLERLIVMSTSHVGFLSAIGGDDAIVGVSSGEYVCDSSVAARIADGRIQDVGYDAAPDYEKIMALKPDLLLAYSVSPVKSRFLTKLESLGVKTFIVNEHLERHPLARAAYIRLFGALTGNMPAADSTLRVVSENYLDLKNSVSEQNDGQSARKILVNIPYKDQWFIPGGENYLTNLFKDAGGEILGADPGSSASGQISVETAYSLSKDANLWMNVGWCRTLDQLLSVNPLFEDFIGNIRRNALEMGYAVESDGTGAEESGSLVWNDNRRLNSNGGNDFWESGAVRPDLLLRDLIGIFSGRLEGSPVYYRAVEQ